MSLDSYPISLALVPADKIYTFSVPIPTQRSQTQPNKTVSSDADRDFLTVAELSEYLGVKRSTLYAMVKDNAIPYHRVGKKLIRFKRGDIDAWMTNHGKDEISVDKRAKAILKRMNKPVTDIDSIIKKAIAQTNGVKYNASSGNQVESSARKGGNHGII